jgi:hypothetical protein
MLFRRKAFLLILFAFLASILGAQPASNLFQMGAPGTVQLKYGLLLDGKNASNPEQVNLFLKSLNLKPLGSTINLSSGTGVVLTADGKILTNAHVVLMSGNDRLAARLALLQLFQEQFTLIESMSTAERQKRSIPSSLRMEQLAKDLGHVIRDSPIVLQLQVNNIEIRSVRILAADVERDLALVESDFVDLTPLRLGDSSSLQVGDDVVALGYPLGATLEDIFSEVVTTMTRGSVSALRTANLGIQHTASISHGNSGGPLLNSAGEVIGINTAGIAAANNLNLAIPSNKAKDFLREYKYAAVVTENEALPLPSLATKTVQERNEITGKGMVTLVGFPSGTPISLFYNGIRQDKPIIMPDGGVLVLRDQPFGTVRLEADVMVYDKIYYPSYVEDSKVVKIFGYPPGTKLRLDETKDYVVPANGILELPTDNKQHTLYALPGWGRGFATSIELSSELNYTVTFASGSLGVSGLPPEVDVTVNGEVWGKSDESGQWRSDFVPVGPVRIGINTPLWVAKEVEARVLLGETSKVAVVANPAGRLSLSTSQPWKNLSIRLTDSAGQNQELPEVAGNAPLTLQISEGTFRLKARLSNDIADYLDETILVTAGLTTDFTLPAIEYTELWRTEQARLAAEKKQRFEQWLQKLFFVGIQIGDPVPYALTAGANLDPVELKVGLSWFPAPKFYGITGTTSFWFSKVGALHFGAGIYANYFHTQSQIDYGETTPATVDYSIIQIGPSLLAKWRGFSIDTGISWVMRHRTPINPPDDGIGFHVLAGWFWNY